MKEIWLCLDSSAIGGIETHVAALAKELNRIGEPVRVILIQDHGPHPLTEMLDKQCIRYLVAKDPRSWFSLIRSRGPALIHTHGYKANILGRIAGTMYGIACVATYHSGDPGLGLVRYYTEADRLSGKPFEKIAVSQPIAETLSGPTTLVQNFVSVPDSRASLTGNRMLFVGRLSEEKGPDTFCRLAVEMKEERFECLGDGPMGPELRAGLSNDLTFHGTVPNVGQHLLNADAVIMPSRQEGLPMAALEAMAAGVPVIAYAVGGLPNLIRHCHNGFLIEPGNFEELRNTVQRYLDMPIILRRAIGKAARQTIVGRFSPSVQVPKIIDVYRRVGYTDREMTHALAA